jgi:hypothetical protein
MDRSIGVDLTEMKKKLSEYVDKGRIIGYTEVREEPAIMEKPDKTKIKPLKKANSCNIQILAIDCSTRTLKRANNWGVYLLRSSYALVKGRNVEWNYIERIRTIVGDAYVRFRFLEDARVELESEMGIDLVRKLCERDYLLLDGASYFGARGKFRVSLYERCERDKINLLAISKQSPTLHDESGRDLIAVAQDLSSFPIWVYHPVAKADLNKHLYGDISIAKFSEDSPRIFRCDIMKYLIDSISFANEMLSPLTAISEDPRCIGYPITLWLAHEFSRPSEAMLLHYHDQIENVLKEAGLLNILHKEELACNFPDMLHGAKHAFNLEWVEHV